MCRDRDRVAIIEPAGGECCILAPAAADSTVTPEVAAHEVPVLIADDERPIASVVAEAIRDLGFQPVIAADGRQALALARATRPALLITDLMMPGLTGADLIAVLRTEMAEAGRDPIPSIVMTAAGAAYAQRAHADAVLDKPFELKDLEELVLRVLAGVAP